MGEGNGYGLYQMKRIHHQIHQLDAGKGNDDTAKTINQKVAP
jgi:hypothetical protein